MNKFEKAGLIRSENKIVPTPAGHTALEFARWWEERKSEPTDVSADDTDESDAPKAGPGRPLGYSGPIADAVRAAGSTRSLAERTGIAAGRIARWGREFSGATTIPAEVVRALGLDASLISPAPVLEESDEHTIDTIPPATEAAQ